MSEEDKAPVRIPDDAILTGTKKFQEHTEEKLKNIDNLMYAIVAAVVISSLSALIAVGAIVIDQLHFNNETYRDGQNLQMQLSARDTESKNLENEISNLTVQMGLVKTKLGIK